MKELKCPKCNSVKSKLKKVNKMHRCLDCHFWYFPNQIGWDYKKEEEEKKNNGKQNTK